MKIFIFLSILFFSCKDTHKTEYKFKDKIDNYLNAHSSNKKFNGTILIANSDSILYLNSYGYANKEHKILNTDSTKFLIGSITKPFVATIILTLEEQGLLNLNDKLSKYFPNFPKSDSVTIYNLLTHTSGITDYHFFNDWVKDSKKDISPNYTIERVLEKPYIFEPGTKFQYSNTGYILLGLIIEKVTNFKFAEYLKLSILDKYELNNSGVIDNKIIINNLANGYSTTLVNSNKADYINYNQPFTSGNMYSNVYDLWNFSRLFFNNKIFNKNKTNEILTNNKGKYGYGWGIRQFDEVLAYGHYGGMNGFIGSLTFIPDIDIFIIFLTNDDNTPKFKITNDFVKILNDKEIEFPQPLKLYKLTNEEFNKVKGRYLIKDGVTLNIFSEQNKYYLKETGQLKHEIFPISKNEFVFQLLEFNLVFEFDENTNANRAYFSINKENKFKKIE